MPRLRPVGPRVMDRALRNLGFARVRQKGRRSHDHRAAGTRDPRRHPHLSRRLHAPAPILTPHLAGLAAIRVEGLGNPRVQVRSCPAPLGFIRLPAGVSRDPRFNARWEL